MDKQTAELIVVLVFFLAYEFIQYLKDKNK